MKNLRRLIDNLLKIIRETQYRARVNRMAGLII